MSCRRSRSGRVARATRSGWLAVLVVVAACGTTTSTTARQGALGCPGSTLRCTLRDPFGTGVLVPGAAEPLLTRTDLAPQAAVARNLLLFADIADAHVTDAQSPLRVEAIHPIGGAVSSAFRPQETLTTQVLAAMEVTINQLQPRVVLETGDLIDNAQRNELDWALTVLRGGRVTPDSGSAGYVGVQSASSPDPFLYRPDVDAPRHPGLLAAATEPFVASGLRAAWLPVLSNHDLLVQGNVPADPLLRAIAVGDRKLLGPSAAAVALARRGQLDVAALEELLRVGGGGRFVTVPPDPHRRLMSAGEAMQAVSRASGVEAAPAMRRAGLLAYQRQLVPGVWLVALDTADRHQGAVGVLPAAEIRWLQATLAGLRGAHIIVHSPTPLEQTRGGDAALGLLDHTRGVVAVLAGDTHRNLITPRRSSFGGYWLVRTASLVDYPQQARAFRLVQLVDGRVALETWMLDHAGADNAPGYLGLAGISRDLAELDYQGGRPRGYAGGRSDRNAILYLPLGA